MHWNPAPTHAWPPASDFPPPLFLQALLATALEAYVPPKASLVGLRVIP